MRQIFVLSLPLLLAACLGDRQAPPPDAAVMPPDHWREETTAGDPVDAQWWNSFGDPVLSTLVGRALEHNPKIEQAAANVAQARAKLRVAQASQGPELDFRGIGGRTKQLESTGPITTWGAETEGTLDYDFDLFGRLASAKEAARAEMLASKASADAVKLAIAGTVASAYIALLGDDRRLAITEDTLAARQASLDLERRLATTGYASQLELRQAEAEYRSTEQLVPQAKLAVTETENAISVLIGVPPSDLARESRGLERLSVPTVPAILPSELMRRRPDIFAAEEQVVAADHSYDSARAAMLPDFSLTGRSEAVFATVLPDPENAFLLGGSVLAPLFDSGRRRAAADAMAAARDAAALSYRDTVLKSFQEVENALASITRTDERSVALVGEVDASAALLKVATARYRAGYASYLDQIDAERGLLSAQLALAEAETDRLGSYVTLYRALGGGWVPPAART